MSIDYVASWATDPHHPLQPERDPLPDLEALPTRVASPRPEYDSGDYAATRLDVATPDSGEMPTTHVDIGGLPAGGDDLSDPALELPPVKTTVRMPDEYVQTRFLARKDESPRPRISAYPTPDCAPALPLEAVTTTHELPKTRGRGRTAILIGAFTAVGVMLGTGVGLSAQFEAEEASLPRHSPAIRPSGLVAAALPAATPEPPAEVAVDAPNVEPLAEPTVQAPAEPAADPLAGARAALAEGELVQAQTALDAAQGADATEAARLGVQLAVLRGDGELGVVGARALATSSGEADDYVALGRLLSQAERDDEAAGAFDQALSIDADHAAAHFGRAAIHARAAQISAARRHTLAAEPLVGEDTELRALAAATQALVSLERGAVSLALHQANEARSIDHASPEASVLLARVAIQSGRDPSAHLRDALRARSPAPVALGMLAPRTDDPEEACTLARRYLETAPDGFDADDMRGIANRCD